MKDIFTVAKFTMKDMLGRKSFRTSTLIILVLIVLGFNVPNIINAFTHGEGLEDKVLFVDRDELLGDFSKESEENSNDENIDSSVIWGQFNDEEIKEKLANDDIQSAWIITKGDRKTQIKLQYLVKNRATAPAPSNETILMIQGLYSQNQLLKQNFSEAKLQEIYPTVSVDVQQIDEEEISGNIFAMMMVSIALFYAIYFCAFQVSSAITTEKTSKIIETLVTSTSPKNIVLGKTFGIGIVGLLQMILIVATAIISAQLFLAPDVLANLLDLSKITPLLGIITLVYFVLGYFLFAFIYALTGSTVSKPEDIQSANAPVAIVSMIGFYLAYFTLTDPTSSLNVFAALLPISSPFCMPIRMMMGLASTGEILLSIAILLVTTLIIASIAIKIYSDAILNYGTKLNLKELIKLYRQK